MGRGFGVWNKVSLLKDRAGRRERWPQGPPAPQWLPESNLRPQPALSGADPARRHCLLGPDPVLPGPARAWARPRGPGALQPAGSGEVGGKADEHQELPILKPLPAVWEALRCSVPAAPRGRHLPRPSAARGSGCGLALLRTEEAAGKCPLPQSP